jgi:hypothetical protein
MVRTEMGEMKWVVLELLSLPMGFRLFLYCLS